VFCQHHRVILPAPLVAYSTTYRLQAALHASYNMWRNNKQRNYQHTRKVTDIIPTYQESSLKLMTAVQWFSSRGSASDQYKYFLKCKNETASRNHKARVSHWNIR